MAILPMRLERIEWNNVADTITITFVDTSPPPPPPVGHVGGWFPQAGASVTITVPSRRAPETTQTALAYLPQSDGTQREVRYEYINGAWKAVS